MVENPGSAVGIVMISVIFSEEGTGRKEREGRESKGGEGGKGGRIVQLQIFLKNHVS